MSVDPVAAAATANAAAVLATAAVQALSEVLQPASMSAHKLSLPTFWLEDLAGWFQHAEAEFTLARLPANSYVCYMHVIRALPSEILIAVRDVTRDITANTPDPCLQLKEALLARFTVSPLQQCFRLLDMPPLGDCHPSALFAEMQALLPREANVLVNAIFLRRLPEFICIALTDRGELLPGELAAAADLLQHSTPATAASIAAISSPPQPPAVHAVQLHFRRRQSHSPSQ
jgi:hypothetical protein